MKLKVAISPVILILFLSCQKEQNLRNAFEGTSTGELASKIDNQGWVALDSSKSASIMNGFITISGTSSDRKTIAISLNDTATGTYKLNRNTISIATYTDSITYIQDFSTAQSSDISLAGGEVTVTEIDKINKTISGTFQLNLYSDSARYKKVVTEGVFNKLSYITSLPPAKSTDTFYTQIDGLSWVAPSISATIIAGQIFIKGSKSDASRSVIIKVPEGPSAFGFHNFNGYSFVGQYIDGDTSFFSNNYTHLPDGSILIDGSTGAVNIIENNISARRIKGSFDFKAITSTSAKTVQLSNGYFSVGY